MQIEYNGKNINVNIIGGFEFNNKKYSVCSYNDGETQKIVIVEVYEDLNGLHTANIPNEEMPAVIEHFNAIKKELMEDNNE